MSDERLTKTFLDLVRIDSPTGFEQECGAYCAEALQSAGCSVHFDDSSSRTGSDTGNLVAVLPGTSAAVLALSAHLDCVEPCRGVEPIVAYGVVTSAGDTVLGADDKVGLAAIIEAVRRFSESAEPHPTIKVLFTVQEEVGLVGAKELPAEAAASDLCLVLDAEGAPGGVVVAAPTHYTFRAEFAGRAAHAGVSPEEGMSAVRMAADAIMRMDLGRLDERTTANIGSVLGGGATNVVPAQCVVTGECRSLDRGRVDALRAAMDGSLHGAAEAAGGTVDVTWKLEYEGFSLDEDSEAVRLLSEACRDVGLVCRTYSTGGGSDANVFAASGVTALALACGMTGVHGTDEEIALDDVVALTRLVGAVGLRMAGGPRP